MVTSIGSQEAKTTLKPGWRMVRFGDVVRNIQVNVNPEESGLEHYVAGEHMETDNLHIKSWGTIGDGYLGPAFHRKFVKGQVLYGSRRTYLRKVALADFDGICANTTFVLEANDDQLLQDLLPFIMQTEAFAQHAIKQSRGSVNPYVNWKDIAWYEFALPPKDEQRRIADILWAADREKQALLYAIECVQKLIYKVGTEIFTVRSDQRVLLKELVSTNLLELQTGPFGTVLKASSYVSKGTPLINPVNMLNGKLITSSGPFLNDKECSRLSKYKLIDKDIILGRKGDIGKIVYITKEYEGFIMGSDCIRIRLKSDEIQSKFFYHFLISPQTHTWLIHHATGTTMPGMNEKTLATLEVPILDTAIQQDIVRMFNIFDSNLELLDIKLKSCNNLMKALTNQLVIDEIIKNPKS